VHDYLQRAEAANIKWPLPEGFDDNRLEAALFRRPTTPVVARRAPPDYAAVHEQWQKPHVTLQLLWEEYQETNPDGYRYSRFCELYQRWRRKQDVVLRHAHRIEMRGIPCERVAGNRADAGKIDPKRFTRLSRLALLRCLWRVRTPPCPREGLCPPDEVHT
jgi:hypothetical protein